MKLARNRSLTWIMMAGLMATTAACSSSPLNVFSRDKAEEVEETPVADDGRVPVLALENRLEPDVELASSITLPPPYINASWPQPGGDADHTMHHLGAELTLDRLWSRKVTNSSGRRAPLLSPPVVADSRIFVIDSKAHVTAFDTAGGKEVWTTELTPDLRAPNRKWYEVMQRENPAQIGFGGGVAYDTGRIFATSGFGFVAALDAETGETLWTHQAETPIRTAPTATNGLVYVVTNSNEMLALNQETGEVEWDYQSFEETARFLAATSPAANAEIVIAPFSSGEIAALRADNGQELWRETVSRSSRMTALSNLSDIAGSPVIDRGTVFAVSHAGQMSAIDLRSGRTQWEAPIAGLQTPWVAGDFIFVLSVENELVSMSREDGRVAWIQELPRYENEKRKKNRITWNGPIIAGGQLVLTSSSGEVLLLDPKSGDTMGRRKIGKGSNISPVLANQQLFILTENGKLTAYQ